MSRNNEVKIPMMLIPNGSELEDDNSDIIYSVETKEAKPKMLTHFKKAKKKKGGRQPRRKYNTVAASAIVRGEKAVETEVSALEAEE